MGEFDLIARHLAPLAGEGAFGLRDDAAERFGLVLTKDVLVSGVHFLAEDPPGLVARKALRVNISDLLSKGVRPEAYLLGLTLPQGFEEEAVAAFAEGLGEEQEVSGITLLGGDTTSGPVLTVSVTMIGRPGPGGMVRRSGGRPGDGLYVTGTIGDGLLGLEAARRGALDAARPYHLPDIPLWAPGLVAAHARAALDVSDGLVADAGHLARESGLQLVIEAERVPLSGAGTVAAAAGRLGDLLGGGDDYQILFLAGDEDGAEIGRGLPEGARLTRIGTAEAGRGVSVLDRNGDEMVLARNGWDHLA